MESIHIADGNDEKKNRDAIPTILSDALAVSFDTHVGHDYLQDYEARGMSHTTRKKTKPNSAWSSFNKITKGGLPNKTLNIALAGTGVGKSLFMCHVALRHSLTEKMCYISRLKWLKKRLQSELMQTFSMYPFKR